MFGPRTAIQSEAAECGLACLAIASSQLGGEFSLSELRRKFPVSIRGLTLAELVDLAASMDMSARAVRCDLDDLCDLALPAVLHWGQNHFVVLQRVRGNRIWIDDPAVGRRIVKRVEASRKFTGVALELSRTPAFKQRRQRSNLNISSLFQWSPALYGGLLQIFVLSLVVQAYVLASPFYLRIAIDEAALRGDLDLLAALGIGFGAFAIFNVVADALRGIAVQRASGVLCWDMTVRLFRHLIRLPLPWFERRKLADTLTRFESLNPIRQLVSNGLIASVIDGILSVATFALMFLFSWQLAVVSVVALSIQFIIKLAAIPLGVRLASEALVASVSEQGKRIETLRALQTIKVLGGETEREGVWSNAYAEVIRTSQASSGLNVLFKSMQGALEALSYVLIIYIGARSVALGDMTVGILFSFMMYRQSFQRCVTGLFETLLSWKMLEVHSDRIGEIALEPIESGIDRISTNESGIEGRIDVRNIAFRHAPHDKFVFRSISFSIEPGEFVAFVGPSGSGKTTLMKVLVGLYAPTYGEVMLDGRRLDSWGPRSFRRAFGVVLQDDDLLAGSIAENVAFFSENIDVDRVVECLRLAAVLDDVMAMPMQIQTLVGDMGSALSGGQKQRIILARALYRQPKILVLDEATSHLDPASEARINESLRELRVTRLIVAHRPQTVAAADRVILIQDGGVALDRRSTAAAA